MYIYLTMTFYAGHACGKRKKERKKVQNTNIMSEGYDRELDFTVKKCDKLKNRLK